MKIVFNTFNGMLPRPNVGIKPDNCAKVAWNCDLRDGRLRPLKQGLLVSSDYPVVLYNGRIMLLDPEPSYSMIPIHAEVTVGRLSGEARRWMERNDD